MNDEETNHSINTEAQIKWQESVAKQLKTLENSFAQYGSTEFIIAKDDDEAAKLWFARRNASPATAIYGTKKSSDFMFGIFL